MPVILGIELGDWLLGGAALYAGSAVVGGAQGVGQGVQQATSTLTTLAVIGGAAFVAYLLLRK